jgi:quinol-cytochrome oxidoreductase complex cytochrome b subunit
MMSTQHEYVAQIARCAIVASTAVILVSGAFLALVYEPSSKPMFGRLYRAESDIHDTSGAILLRRGEIALVENMPPYRGIVHVLGDTSSTNQTIATLSHNLIKSSIAGRSLLYVHSFAASALVLSAALLWVAMVLAGSSPLRRWAVLGVVLLTMVNAWLGKTLSGDRSGDDTYAIGRTLIVENLPILGDIVAEGLPERSDAARQFAMHALWFAPMLLGLSWCGCACGLRTPFPWLLSGAAALALVAGGLTWGAVVSPIVGSAQSKPEWYLGVPFALLHALPTDATMLILLVWWGALIAASTSRSEHYRWAAVALLAVWFGAGAIASFLLKS